MDAERWVESWMGGVGEERWVKRGGRGEVGEVGEERWVKRGGRGEVGEERWVKRWIQRWMGNG